MDDVDAGSSDHLLIGTSGSDPHIESFVGILLPVGRSSSTVGLRLTWRLVFFLSQMHDEIGPGFSEEFIREVVTALATIGAKNGLVTQALQPRISLQPSASIPVDLQGVPSAETFGSLQIFSDPAESKKFWESDVGRSIIRYFYLILLVAGHLYEEHPAGARDQKIQELIGLLAKQYQEFRLHEISPQFESTPEPYH